MALDKVMHVRTTGDELKEFAAVARMLGLTNSELLRIMVRADKQVIWRAAAQEKDLEKERAVIYLAIDEDVFALAQQIRRFGLLLNQATRSLNDLRRRKSLAANYVVERLVPIEEILTLIAQDFSAIKDEWELLRRDIDSNSWAKIKGGMF
ncbi:hypothetical protein [Adlercreutzia caecimuris]|mgnify:CR=1 FL=1|jgi:hypothetical protein|uniref:Ribbon-helix-helix protein CopG domain-containing protein n=1 Tax=Adlercreutzia caecimuris B7 TaxID=1235794 RepID=R9L268_9ACTN|nr:hypothetical protein [Adlercreutzia caecimuris]EOS52546.1 hypothetical protein C811_00582 [Adlercreutzia caecimuris B7]